MENKQHYRDRNAGVGHVKCRPGIGVSNVQIEKEKIDHVPVKQAISQVAQNASKQQGKREVAEPIRRSRSDEQSHYNH